MTPPDRLVQAAAELRAIRDERREQIEMLTSAIRVGDGLGVNVLAFDPSVPLSYVLDFGEAS